MLEAFTEKLQDVVLVAAGSSTGSSNTGGGQPNPRLAVSSSSYQTFLLTLVINLAICLVSFFLFCLLRTRVKTLYSYKLSKYLTRKRNDRSKLFELDDIDDEESSIVKSFHDLDKQKEGLSESTFGWISSVFKYPDSKVLESQGIDALMLLRSMKMMMLVIGIAMIYGLAVLLTINYNGPFKLYPEDNPLRPNDLDLFTLSNIAPGSQLMWFHVIGVYLITFVTFAVLYRNYSSYVVLREQWRSAPEPRNFMVQLTGFEPESNEESIAQTIKTLLNINMEPVHVTLVRQLPKRLKKLLAKKKKATKLLETAKLELNTTGKRPTIKLPKHTDLQSLLSPINQPSNYSELDSDYDDDEDEVVYETIEGGGDPSQQMPLPRRRDPAKVNGYRTSGVFLWPIMGCCMKWLKKTKVKCDAISYYAARLERINHDIIQLQSQYQSFINNDIAFVHCPSILHAAKLGMCQIERNADKWRTKMASNPGDINWNSIVHHHYPRSHQRWLNAFVWIAVILLVGVWAIPVTFVISFTQFDNLKNLPLLSKVIPGLCDSLPIVCSLVQGYLPSLALVIVTALVPYMIEYMLKLVRHITYTNRERSLLQKYFVWLCVNIFFVVTATGTFYEVLAPALDDPKILVDMLATSIPSSSSFYIYYLITQGLGAAFFSMLRPWELITMGFWKIKPRTELDKKEFRENKAHNCLRYSTLIPQILTAFLITMIYSCISPLILPFGFLYMISLFFISKYYIIYEHVPKWPFGGGEMFQDVYGIIIAVLLLMQVTMFGIFGLKKFTAGIVMMAILPIFTAIFHSTIKSKYGSAAINPSLFRLYERIEKEPVERYQEASLEALVAYKQPSIHPHNANPIQNAAVAPLISKGKEGELDGVGIGLGGDVATDIYIGDR